MFFLFGLLELTWPYTFLKDDNINQFLPVLIEGMRQLFDGTLPVFNHYQYMGSPLLEYGTYAVLYPPLILSYALAEYVFGNPFLTLELFVFIHIILGYCCMYFFLRSQHVRKLIALLGSLAFVFSGYALSASSSWYYVAPVLVFLPLLFYLVILCLLLFHLYVHLKLLHS